jgi:hypothetical protein
MFQLWAVVGGISQADRKTSQHLRAGHRFCVAKLGLLLRNFKALKKNPLTILTLPVLLVAAGVSRSSCK